MEWEVKDLLKCYISGMNCDSFTIEADFISYFPYCLESH